MFKVIQESFTFFNHNIACLCKYFHIVKNAYTFDNKIITIFNIESFCLQNKPVLLFKFDIFFFHLFFLKCLLFFSPCLICLLDIGGALVCACANYIECAILSSSSNIKRATQCQSFAVNIFRQLWLQSCELNIVTCDGTGREYLSYLGLARVVLSYYIFDFKISCSNIYDIVGFIFNV